MFACENYEKDMSLFWWSETELKIGDKPTPSEWKRKWFAVNETRIQRIICGINMLPVMIAYARVAYAPKARTQYR